MQKQNKIYCTVDGAFQVWNISGGFQILLIFLLIFLNKIWVYSQSAWTLCFCDFLMNGKDII